MEDFTPDNSLDYSDFEKVDIRTGTILEAVIFEGARSPAYQLRIDFGALGSMKSSAKLTMLYKPEDLIGMQILAVVNFPPKQIGNFMSECLVLGACEGPEVTLLTTERKAKNGLRIS